MRDLSRPRELHFCEEEMAANPILGRGVTHSGAGVLPGLLVLNVAGTSVGERILAQGQRLQQTIPHGSGGSVSVQRVAAIPTPPQRVSVSLSLSPPPPHFLCTHCTFCVHDTDECCCSSCGEADNFC
jgi:hypothetical protein